MVPPAETFVLNDRGMTAWKAVFDTLTVERLPGGMRCFKVTVDNSKVYERIFTAGEAAHLAHLLSDPVAR